MSKINWKNIFFLNLGNSLLIGFVVFVMCAGFYGASYGLYDRLNPIPESEMEICTPVKYIESDNTILLSCESTTMHTSARTMTLRSIMQSDVSLLCHPETGTCRLKKVK